jgi:threonine aldolase
MPDDGLMDDDEFNRLRAASPRWLNGPPSPAALLADIPAGTAPDTYGVGGVVAELENEVAELLGKPAAVFLPSGTMAQQIALRVHADARGRRTVAFHPLCHLDLFEGRGYERLHGLVGRPVGHRGRLITHDDLQTISEPLAALLIELPQREIGGALPVWDDLVAQTAWARAGGAAVHLDGARLWESTAGFGRTPAEIAALFDTVYVSFYKGIGAIAGCALAGDAAVVAQVREWRHRHGGTLFALWPYAASALTCLRRRLPLMPRYFAHAKDIAAALSGLDGVTVLPDPPQTPMMHLLLRTDATHVRAVAERFAGDGVRTWSRGELTGDPAMLRFELSVGDAVLEFSPGELREIVGAFVR